MFGRRKRDQTAAAEAARESERRALFAKLAERPENICPFLGLAGDRAGYVDGINDEHRCFAFGDPAPISAEQQTRVCQERGYGNCPRYLRGVLVIPTEELEALRRPRPTAAAPVPATSAVAGRRRRSPILALVLGLALLAAAGVGAFLALNPGDGIGQASPTPEPLPTASASAEPSAAPASATPEPTAVVLPSAGATIPPLPTAAPDAEFSGYIVAVAPGRLPVVEITDDTVGEERVTEFATVSGAPVDLVEIDGVRYWVTLAGDYNGLAYVDGFSGDEDDFKIFEAYENPDGSAGFVEIPPGER